LCIDRRRENCVPCSDFLAILATSGITLDRNQQQSGGGSVPSWTKVACPPRHAQATTDRSAAVRDALLRRFVVDAPPRCSTLGRDDRWASTLFIDYEAFCTAVEPLHNGRDTAVREQRGPPQAKDVLLRLSSQAASVTKDFAKGRGQPGIQIQARPGQFHRPNFKRRESLLL